MSGEMNPAGNDAEHDVAAPPDLALALLAELAGHATPVSTARVSKRLGVRQSTLLRCLAYLGDDVIGGVAGPGLVRVSQDGERTMLALSDKGRAACQ
jgi:hypothetical protein